MLKYYLGIDGGVTKTKFVLGLEDGTVVGEYTGGGCHYMQIGFDGLTALMRKGISAVCANAGAGANVDAGAGADACTGAGAGADTIAGAQGGYGHCAITPSDIAFAYAGCAGIGDIAADQPNIAAALAAAFGDIPFAYGNDLENALAGALGGKSGIVVIAGTGSNCGGRNNAGDFARCGGWHYALGGDEGSAFWIGYRLLNAFSRQSDGRDRKTPLYDAVVRELDLHSDDEMVTRVVTEWNLSRTKIASLATLCAALAKSGDPVSVSILQDAAEALAEFAVVVRAALSDTGHGADADSGAVADPGADADPGTDAADVFGTSAVPVSGIGGVFRSGPVFTDAFARAVAKHGMTYVEPLHTPDIGALLLAVQNDRASGK